MWTQCSSVHLWLPLQRLSYALHACQLNGLQCNIMGEYVLSMIVNSCLQIQAWHSPQLVSRGQQSSVENVLCCYLCHLKSFRACLLCPKFTAMGSSKSSLTTCRMSLPSHALLRKLSVVLCVAGVGDMTPKQGVSGPALLGTPIQRFKAAFILPYLAEWTS